MMIEKTCNTCKHFGQCDHEGYGRCNLNVPGSGTVSTKQDSPACEGHWDDQDGQLWRDSFGFIWRYDWATNSFICDQTGQTLALVYKEKLWSIRDNV